MQVVQGIDGLKSVPPGAVLSVGNFDGLHRGHQKILLLGRQLRRQERERSAPTPGTELVVVTFEPHPLTVLRPELAPPRLTPASLKRELLAAGGVDRLVVLPPTPDVLNLSAEDFWAVLSDHVRPAHLVEGATFTFGKDRRGTIEKARQWAAAGAIRLHEVPAQEAVLTDLSVVAASSSLVRWLLSCGRVRDAAICLGRPYVLEGRVVEGYRRGRTIGTPTANLEVDGQMVPLEGVYAGRCAADAHGAAFPAAVSIGRMETFGRGLAFQVEAHLVGYDGDLYGRTLRVELLDWVREQRKFADVDALKRRIATDVESVRERAGMRPELEIARATVEMLRQPSAGWHG